MKRKSMLGGTKIKSKRELAALLKKGKLKIIGKKVTFKFKCKNGTFTVTTERRHLVKKNWPAVARTHCRIAQYYEDQLRELRTTFENNNILNWCGGYLVKTDFPYVPATIDPANLRLFYISLDGRAFEFRNPRSDYVWSSTFLLQKKVNPKQVLRKVKSKRVLREIARVVGTVNPALFLVICPGQTNLQQKNKE